jgi:hypothetical protein
MVITTQTNDHAKQLTMNDYEIFPADLMFPTITDLKKREKFTHRLRHLIRWGMAGPRLLSYTGGDIEMWHVWKAQYGKTATSAWMDLIAEDLLEYWETHETTVNIILNTFKCFEDGPAELELYQLMGRRDLLKKRREELEIIRQIKEYEINERDAAKLAAEKRELEALRLQRRRGSRGSRAPTADVGDV